MLSSATIELKEGVFREGNPKPLIIQRFQDMQLLPFQQSAKKTRSFFSGFQDSVASRTHCNRGATEWEALKFSVREVMPVTNLG